MNQIGKNQDLTSSTEAADKPPRKKSGKTAKPVAPEWERPAEKARKKVEKRVRAAALEVERQAGLAGKPAPQEEGFKDPWLPEYKIHGIPATLEPYPHIPTHTFLDTAARRNKKMGYVQLGYFMKYPEAWDKAERLACALTAMGVGKGDRVATILPTSIQFVLADHAISKAGAVHVPCSFLEPPDHLEHKFRESQPKVICTLDTYMDMVEALRKQTHIEHVIVSNLEDFSEKPPRHQSLPEGMRWLTKLLEEYPPSSPQVDFNPEKDIETLLFTGGTTGLPKGCMLTHFNITANSIQNGWALGIISRIMRGNIAMLLGTPFFHSYGHCIMHTMTHLGMKQLLIPDARDTKSMAQMIREHRPIMAVGVPTQFMKLLDEELKGTGILGLSGSAALPPETQQQFDQKAAGAVMEGYGLSELSPVTHVNTSAMIRLLGGRRIVALMSRLLQLPGLIKLMNMLIGILGSKLVGAGFGFMIPKLSKFSGKRPKLKGEEKRATIGIPFPDTDIKILDVDTQAEISLEEMVSQGRLGEMLLRGPQRMLGYWPDEGKGYDDEGYIHTGDVVKIDDKGYFYIVDRTKDMIIVSGYKVYSREVDDILYDHPAVAMAATIGVPDPDRPGSERVKVFIQLKPEQKGKVSEQEIIDYLQPKVAKYAIPRAVTFIDEMPLTEVQKVNKKYLREMELEEMKTPHPSTGH
ncbi:MAG: AMP-binding protein [Proteobacteria bacterium]|nr:AMP-binding protein [Pseudomonadota bacterium]